MNSLIRSLAHSLTFTILAASVQAQAPKETKFAPPVRLKSGDAFMGGGRLYPSPVFKDMNGDGLPDVVIGDLFGRITVSLRLPGKDPRAFAAETELMAADGKRLDFHNW
ncbi:MAG: hypothetical protein HY286_12220 [Planctomycetes bacterium]|nr:hypothetical protein [Planctomycetota bacterium]